MIRYCEKTYGRSIISRDDCTPRFYHGKHGQSVDSNGQIIVHCILRLDSLIDEVVTVALAVMHGRGTGDPVSPGSSPYLDGEDRK
jgi:hypothetical protein